MYKCVCVCVCVCVHVGVGVGVWVHVWKGVCGGGWVGMGVMSYQHLADDKSLNDGMLSG